MIDGKMWVQKEVKSSRISGFVNRSNGWKGAERGDLGDFGERGDFEESVGW